MTNRTPVMDSIIASLGLDLVDVIEAEFNCRSTPVDEVITLKLKIYNRAKGMTQIKVEGYKLVPLADAAIPDVLKTGSSGNVDGGTPY